MGEGRRGTEKEGEAGRGVGLEGGLGGGGGEKGRESVGKRGKMFRRLAPWRFSFSALYLGALSWRPFVAPFLLAFSSRPIFAPFRPRSAESPEMILAPQLGAPRPTHGFAAVRRLRLLSRAVSAFSCLQSVLARSSALWEGPGCSAGPSRYANGPARRHPMSAPLRIRSSACAKGARCKRAPRGRPHGPSRRPLATAGRPVGHGRVVSDSDHDSAGIAWQQSTLMWARRRAGPEASPRPYQPSWLIYAAAARAAALASDRLALLKP